jgi:hypothetical protein
MMVKDFNDKLSKILQMQASLEIVFHIFLAKKIWLLLRKKEELIHSK